jgi:hypothetical protein
VDPRRRQAYREPWPSEILDSDLASGTVEVEVETEGVGTTSSIQFDRGTSARVLPRSLWTIRFYQQVIISHAPNSSLSTQTSLQLVLSPFSSVERCRAVARQRHAEDTLLRSSDSPFEPLRSPREQHPPQHARLRNSRMSALPLRCSRPRGLVPLTPFIELEVQGFLLVASGVQVDLQCHIDGDDSMPNEKVRQRRENGMILMFRFASYQLRLETLSGPSRE